VPATVIFTGLASGALLAAAGLGLWDSLRRVPGLTRAVQVIRWLAGTLLAAGALLAWQGDHSLSAPAPRLILMAALAAPPGTYRRHLPRWSVVWLTLPALALAGAGLLRASESIQAQLGGPSVAVVELVVVICGGLGARALGEALNEIATSALHVDWPSAATYALLTLLVGGTALVNLWQRGSAWAGTAGASGLAGAWLSWSAARIGPRRPPWLRAVLIAVAASFLIALAALDRPFRSQVWFG
jgi:hypothetical protein